MTHPGNNLHIKPAIKNKMALCSKKDILASWISITQSTLFRLALICLSPANSEVCDLWVILNSYIFTYMYIWHVPEITVSEAVTFSHVSGEPVSHFPSPEVEPGSELADIAERLVQFHGCCSSKCDTWSSSVLITDLSWPTSDETCWCVLHCLHADSKLQSGNLVPL